MVAEFKDARKSETSSRIWSIVQRNQTIGKWKPLQRATNKGKHTGNWNSRKRSFYPKNPSCEKRINQDLWCENDIIVMKLFFKEEAILQPFCILWVYVIQM